MPHHGQGVFRQQGREECTLRACRMQREQLSSVGARANLEAVTDTALVYMLFHDFFMFGLRFLFIEQEEAYTKNNAIHTSTSDMR